MTLRDETKERSLLTDHEASGGGKAKREPKARKPKAETPRRKKAAKAIEKLAASGAIDAGKSADRIVKRYSAWQKATANLHDTSKAAAERVKSAHASFEEVIGTTVQTDDQKGKAKKLDAVVGGWQDWQEAIVQGGEERKHAKEARTKAAKALDRAIEETRQLSMLPDED